METLGPSLEVQAVSELLAAIGEDPVEDLMNLPPSGNTALAALRAQSRDFQEEGYWFNCETDYEMTPNADGEIIIPDHIISIAGGDDRNLTERRNKLYDKENKTYKFDGPVECSVILHLPWRELPSAARRLITAHAVELFVDGFPGAEGVTEARHRSFIRAKVAFERAVIRNGGYNLLNNETVQQIMRR